MSDRVSRPVYHVRQAAERGEVVRCTGCVYYRLFSWGGYNGLKACHYMLDTGIPVSYTHLSQLSYTPTLFA